jgi:hypothetical protein
MLAILALVGCTTTQAPPPSGPGFPADPSGDTCRSAQHAALIGQSEAAIGAAGVTEPYRVLKPGSVVTQDYSPARLNIHMNTAGTITRLTCG